METISLFKFKIGDHVDVLCGWEMPLITNCKVINRKRFLKGLGSDIHYENEYLVEKVGGGLSKNTYLEQELKESKALRAVEDPLKDA